MTDWQDANFTVTVHQVFTPSKGPLDGFDDYVWRSTWPWADNHPSWMYFLEHGNIIGFDMHHPALGNVGNIGSSNDLRYYVTNGWPKNIPGLPADLPAMGTVLTHDWVIGGKHEDLLYLGPGNDRLDGDAGADHLAGGDGNDLINGGDGDDVIHGDFVNAPIVLHQNSYNQVFTWEIPTSPDPNVVDGDDVLHGDNGGDTLDGGGGNDQLDGGPRGKGWTDLLTGGPGADIFFLSYQTDNDTSTDETGFWSGWTEDFAISVAKNSTKATVEKLAEASAQEFFESTAGGIVLNLAEGALTSGVVSGLKALFGHTPHPPPPPTTEDVMVVADFDPRVDALYLPVQDGKTLTSQASFFSSAAVPGLEGWGATFSTIDGVYAEVFLDADFLGEFDLTAGDAASKAFVENIFSTSVTFDSGADTATGGIQNPDDVYPFSDDPNDYVDGQVPDGVAEKIALSAPAGTTTRIFGAFGPQVVYGPAISTGTILLSGTDMGDVLSVNVTRFAPANYNSSQLTVLPTIVKGFDGDDIILGGNGQDILDGGDGDDDVYGFQTVVLSGGPAEETLTGGNGNDVLYSGESKALLDGGDGSDTASFALSRVGITADLASGTAQDSGAGADARNTYSLVDIENVIGTDQDDSITGDANDNLIQGNAGSDTLDGGGGGDDTAFYADNTGKVDVDLAAGTTQEYGPDGTADENTIVSTDTLSDLENVIGSAFDDTITGDNNDNSLDGGAGDDTLTGNAGADTLIGGNGDDIVDFADNGSSGITIDLARDIGGRLAGFWEDAFGSSDTVDRATVEAYSGTSANDFMQGDGGGGTNTLFSAHFFGEGGNDTLTGSGLGQTLDGGDGNDRISGLGGADSLIGEAGNDTLSGGAGSDTLDGGNGDDTATYASNAGKVNVDLTAGTTQEYGADGASIVSTDTLSGVENAIGSAFDDTIGGDSAANELDGAAGNDVLSADPGDDTLDGGAGNDTLFGGAGSDTLTGGDGIDLFGDFDDNWNGDVVTDFETGETVVIENFSATDVTFQTPGADGATVLLSGVGSFSLAGTAFDNKNLTVTQSGANAIVTAPASVAPAPITDGGPATGGDDTIDGSNEADLLFGLGGNDRLNGNAGDDTISGHQGDDVIRGEDGDDLLLGGSGDDNEVGGNGNDTLIGGSGDDSLDGGDGDDTLLGGSGDDTAFGGLGNDLVVGGSGNDSIDGGGGDDSVSGGSGRDAIAGGAGDDSLDGGSGADTLDGGSGNDVVRGGGGSDVIAGGDGDDSLLAGTGDDIVGGGDGDDSLYGRNGDDDLDGGDGDDRLIGGGGDDVLVGGLGNDTVTGGGGDDIFVLAAGDGADRIRDFAAGSDLIGLAGGLSFDDLSFAGSDIIAAGETLATLHGVDATTLSEFDFVMQ